MSDLENLRELLKAAYYAGFKDGNGYDWGCDPERFADFEQWESHLSGGSLVSAVAELAGGSRKPELNPGAVVEFDQGDFVVCQMENRFGSETQVLLQDVGSWERKNRVEDVPF